MEYEHELSIDENTGSRTKINFNDELCWICQGSMKNYVEPDKWGHKNIKELDEILRRKPHEVVALQRKHLFTCSTCGWWHSNERATLYPLNLPSRSPYNYCPAIENIDIRSSQVAVDDLIFHLTRRWEDRKRISASSAESLVASLLREHLKCDVISSTANTTTPDRGIDLHVCHDNGEIIAAVQVKRRINRQVEGVAEVRNFVGALAIENIAKGIFVTTATHYTREATLVAEKLKSSTCSRLQLDLVNGRDLFELLKTLPRKEKLILPKGTGSIDIWLDDAGKEHTTRELLYGY
jgi:hypothetical protein